MPGTLSMKPAFRWYQPTTRAAIFSLTGRLRKPSSLPPTSPWATVLTSPSMAPDRTPISGLLVMMRMVPASDDAP